MRIDDVRAEAARGREGRACQLEVLALAATPPVEDGALDLVTARNELFLEPAHEHT